MKLDEAIEILEEQRDLEVFNDFVRIRAGFQLGIEALKREKAWRENPRWGIPPLMPGETEE